MDEEVATPSTAAIGALANIADYTSESEHEEMKEKEPEVVEEMVSVETPTADFEIVIDEDCVDENSTTDKDVTTTASDKAPEMATKPAEISNRFAMREQVEIEEFGSDDELPTLNFSDEDSDVEFDRILSYTAKQRKKEYDRDMGKAPMKRVKNDGVKGVEREYDKMPPIENLTISVQENIAMKRLGSVKHIVDCLVVIEADSGLAIDYESVIFTSERKAIGKVFDIFGAVRCPSYSIRFNSEGEARGMAREGMDVFVADVEEYTHKIFTDKLKNEKHTDGVLVLNERGEEEELYSDDEEEQRARNSGGRGGRGRGGGRGGRGGRGGERGRGRGRGQFNQNKMSWPPRGGGGRGGYSYNSPYAGSGGPPMIDTRYMGGDH